MSNELKNFIIDLIQKKELENPKYIRYTYYELRVKYDCSEEEVDEILEISKNYFENKNYKVYFTGERFEYQNAYRMVQANELMIAIKDDTKFVSAKKCKKRV